jgi:hypothetical protein
VVRESGMFGCGAFFGWRECWFGLQHEAEAWALVSWLVSRLVLRWVLELGKAVCCDVVCCSSRLVVLVLGAKSADTIQSDPSSDEVLLGSMDFGLEKTRRVSWDKKVPTRSAQLPGER